MVMPLCYRDALRNFRVHYYSNLLAVHHGNISHVAKTAGVDRARLYKTLRKLGLFPRVNGADA